MNTSYGGETYPNDIDGGINKYDQGKHSYKATNSCGYFCNYMHHKVHNGYGESPDRVANGNWTKSMVTRIEPK